MAGWWSSRSPLFPTSDCISDRLNYSWSRTRWEVWWGSIPWLLRRRLTHGWFYTQEDKCTTTPACVHQECHRGSGASRENEHSHRCTQPLPFVQSRPEPLRASEPMGAVVVLVHVLHRCGREHHVAVAPRVWVDPVSFGRTIASHPLRRSPMLLPSRSRSVAILGRDAVAKRA